MNNSIENNQLDTELQELYLMGKQWLSELDFFEVEIKSVAKLSQTIPNTVGLTGNPIKLSDSYLLLKDEILAFMNTLGLLMVSSEKQITLSLIENHVKLGKKAEEMMTAFKAERKQVFDHYSKQIHQLGKRKNPERSGIL